MTARAVFRPAFTLVVVAVALMAGWMLWHTYMLSPWTRDGTVRVYIVTIAPEVAGRIVQLNVIDNQYVHKGDLLFVVDPSDYKIAVEDTQAEVEEARERLVLSRSEAERRAQLNELAVSLEQKQIYAVGAATAAATYQQMLSRLAKAQLGPQPDGSAFAGRWLGDQSLVAPRRLQRRRKAGAVVGRRPLLLGGGLFRGNDNRPDQGWGPGKHLADGVPG